jgi:amidophosphoribosyltransferase
VRPAQKRSFLQVALLPSRKSASDTIFAKLIDCSHPHIHGIDLASTSELIAYHRTSAEIATEIGADKVIYQSLEDLVAACAELSPRDPKTQKFEVGVFNGEYVTPFSKGYIQHIESIRGKSKQNGIKSGQTVVNIDAVKQSLQTVNSKSDLGQLKKDLLGKVETTLDSLSDSVRVNGGGDTQDPSLHNFNDFQ